LDEYWVNWPFVDFRKHLSRARAVAATACAAALIASLGGAAEAGAETMAESSAAPLGVEAAPEPSGTPAEAVTAVPQESSAPAEAVVEAPAPAAEDPAPVPAAEAPAESGVEAPTEAQRTPVPAAVKSSAPQSAPGSVDAIARRVAATGAAIDNVTADTTALRDSLSRVAGVRLDASPQDLVAEPLGSVSASTLDIPHPPAAAPKADPAADMVRDDFAAVPELTPLPRRSDPAAGPTWARERDPAFVISMAPSEGIEAGQRGAAAGDPGAASRPAPAWTGGGAAAADATAGDGTRPTDSSPGAAPPTFTPPSTVSGTGGSFFAPIVALLALLALAAPATLRRCLRAPDALAPSHLACALERPG